MLGPLATHKVHSEDRSDWADAQADLSLLWVHSYWFCRAAAHFLYSLLLISRRKCMFTDNLYLYCFLKNIKQFLRKAFDSRNYIGAFFYHDEFWGTPVLLVKKAIA